MVLELVVLALGPDYVDGRTRGGGDDLLRLVGGGGASGEGEDGVPAVPSALGEARGGEIVLVCLRDACG